MSVSSRLLKEAYPVILLGTLMMTWAITSYGVVEKRASMTRKNLADWRRMPASELACSAPAKAGSSSVPQLQLPENDLSWAAARIKKWRKQNDAGGFL